MNTSAVMSMKSVWFSLLRWKMGLCHCVSSLVNNLTVFQVKVPNNVPTRVEKKKWVIADLKHSECLTVRETDSTCSLGLIAF